MGLLDSLMSCSLAGTTINVNDWSFNSEPIIEENIGRIGTKMTVQGEGWVEAADAASFATALSGLASASGGTSGQDFWIGELGGNKVVDIRAAQCTKGPHVSIAIDKGTESGAKFSRGIKFKVEAEQKYDPKGPGGGGGHPAHGYTVKATTNPDGLHGIAVSGQIVGPPSALAYFNDTIEPRWRAAYPLTDWVETAECNQKFEQPGVSDASEVDYSITFSELAEPYPVGALPGAGRIVDGEITFASDRDAAGRLVERTTMDVVVVGDPIPLMAQIRAGLGTPIVSERWSLTHHRQRRFTAEFEVLRSADGDNILAWEQSIECKPQYDTYTVCEYPGLDPILIKNPRTAWRYGQRGRAVGLDRFIDAPDPVLTTMSAPPTVGRSHLPGSHERETTWSYELVATAALTIDEALLKKLAKPVKGVA